MKFLYTLQIFLLSFVSLFSQERGNESNIQDDQQIQVMLLGVYHFDNPGQDKYNLEIDDYFGEKRQQEIKEVVSALAKFEPNKIFIEQKPAAQTRIDSLYNAYSEGRLRLKDLERGRNEIYQIGFKLAKQQGLQKLYSVDANGQWLGSYVDFIADTLNQDFYKEDEKRSQAGLKSVNEQFSKNTVRENLIFTNQEESLLDNQNYYIDVAMRVKDTVGIYFTNQQTTEVIDGKEYQLRSFDFENIGVELVTEWYKRNFLIYRNILENSAKGDKIIIMFGQGHIPILKQLLEDNPKYKVISPLDYLKV